MEKVFVATLMESSADGATVLLAVNVCATRAKALKHIADALMSWVEFSDKEPEFQIADYGAKLRLTDSITYYWGIEEQEVL